MLNYVIFAFLAASITYIALSYLMHPEEAMFPPNIDLDKPISEETKQAYFDLRNVDPNVPVFQRYLRWLHDLIFKPWDEKFGYTAGIDKSALLIMPEITARMALSVRLVIIGTIIGIVVGITIGVYSAIKRGSFFDKSFSVIVFVVIALPAPVIILVIQSLNLSLGSWTGFNFPAVNPINPTLQEGSWEALWYQVLAMFLPTFTIAFLSAMGYSRYMKMQMLDQLGSDYLRTARAKGLTRRAAITKHALRVALIPMGQYLTFAVVGAFSGSFFIERFFNWQGLGSWSLGQFMIADINSATAMVMFGTILTLISMTLADFVQALLDPRIR